MARSSRGRSCYWLSPLLDPVLSRQLGSYCALWCSDRMSSSNGLQTHSLRRLRLPCTGVADPSSSSMIARRCLISSSVLGGFPLLSESAESDESDVSSRVGVGMVSSS